MTDSVKDHRGPFLRLPGAEGTVQDYVRGATLATGFLGCQQVVRMHPAWWREASPRQGAPCRAGHLNFRSAPGGRRTVTARRASAHCPAKAAIGRVGPLRRPVPTTPRGLLHARRSGGGSGSRSAGRVSQSDSVSSCSPALEPSSLRLSPPCPTSARGSPDESRWLGREHALRFLRCGHPARCSGGPYSSGCLAREEWRPLVCGELGQKLHRERWRSVDEALEVLRGTDRVRAAPGRGGNPGRGRLPSDRRERGDVLRVRRRSTPTWVSVSCAGCSSSRTRTPD